MSPIFSINDQYEVQADDILVYAIRESDGSVVYLDVPWDQFQSQQDNVFEIDAGRLASELQPGEYTLHIFGIENALTDLESIEISPTKYELRLKHNDPSLIPDAPDLYRNFDLRINDTFYPILSSIKDVYLDNSLIIKLFTPINSDAVVGISDISVCNHVFDPIVLRIKVESDPSKEIIYRLPNSYVYSDKQTDFLDYNNIVTTSSYSSSIYNLLSMSKGVTPNVDFRYWQNHVYFGSSEIVLSNIYQKMRNWFDYNDNLSLIYSSGNLSELSHSYMDKKNEIVSGFTMYENWVYSSSDGWPKSGGILYHHTSSNAQDWIDIQSGSASDYDTQNRAQIKYMVPEFYIESDQYDVMEKFLYMYADHFDQIRIYIKHLETMMHVDYGTYENIPGEFSWLLANLFGFKLFEGWSGKNLVQYLLGEEVSGSAKTDPYKNITFDTWSRILNNLIYIYKTKGTEESLRSLINCYGIPSTIMRIREYILGSEYTGSDYESYITEPYTARHLLFTGSRYVDVSLTDPFDYDFTVEGKFKIEHRPAAHEEIFLFGGNSAGSATGTFYVCAKSDLNASTVPQISFIVNETGVCSISSGAGVPLFDGNFYTIALVHTGSDSNRSGAFQLYAKRYYEEQLYLDTGSGWIVGTGSHTGAIQSSSVFQLGGNICSSQSFSGACYELRLFTMAVPETYINYHTYNPESIQLPNPTIDYVSNIVRWKLNDTKDLSADAWVSDTSLLPNTWNHGTTYNYTAYIPTFSENVNNYWGYNIDPDTRYYIPEIGPYKYSGQGIDTKVRIISGSTNVTGLVDSPKVSITFAPTDIINKDIAMQYGNLNFNQLMGNYGDLYSSSYSTLKPYINSYFTKYVGAYHFYNFINLVHQLDDSVYDTIKQLFPARVLPSFGLLIESHMLERPKVEWKKPRITSSSLKTVVDTRKLEAIGVVPDNIEGIISPDEIFKDLTGEISPVIERAERESLFPTGSLTGNLELVYSGSNYKSWLNYEYGNTWSIAEARRTSTYGCGAFDWIINRGQTRSQLRFVSYVGTSDDSGFQVSQSLTSPIQIGHSAD